jgi:probable phosphoglycerate mutase
VKAVIRMNPAHICIARHGETDWNRSGILQGWFDVPINELGRQQAHVLADNLANSKFDAVWCSPLARARETAEIIASTLQLPPPNCHEGLKEKHFGAIQGIPKSELAELDPALLEQILRRNPAAEFVGGEGMDEFVDRVLAAFDDIGAHHPGERVLVVTHGWVMDVVTRHITGHNRNTVLHLKPKNGDCLWVQIAQQQFQAATPSST